MYSYGQLLASLNESDSYFPLYKQPNLYLFFVNLIKALANNAPLVLLDADLNEAEIEGLNVAEINAPKAITSAMFKDMGVVVDAVKRSTSERQDNLRRWPIASKRLQERFAWATNIQVRCGRMPTIQHTWRACKCSFKPL